MAGSPSAGGRRSTLRRFFSQRVRDLEMSSIRLACLLPYHALRIWVLKAWGAKIGANVTVYHGVQVRLARRLTVGANTIIGDGSILDARGGLTIGENVNLSTAVQIWTGQHDWRARDFAYVSAPVTVGTRSWLSARTIVLPGVDIGVGAVLAAGAVASGSIPDFTIAGGVPARPIGVRPESIDYVLPPSSRKNWWW